MQTCSVQDVLAWTADTSDWLVEELQITKYRWVLFGGATDALLACLACGVSAESGVGRPGGGTAASAGGVSFPDDTQLWHARGLVGCSKIQRMHGTGKPRPATDQTTAWALDPLPSVTVKISLTLTEKPYLVEAEVRLGFQTHEGECLYIYQVKTVAMGVGVDSHSFS